MLMMREKSSGFFSFGFRFFSVLFWISKHHHRESSGISFSSSKWNSYEMVFSPFDEDFLSNGKNLREKKMKRENFPK